MSIFSVSGWAQSFVFPTIVHGEKRMSENQKVRIEQVIST